VLPRPAAFPVELAAQLADRLTIFLMLAGSGLISAISNLMLKNSELKDYGETCDNTAPCLVTFMKAAR
jgi:hypothetical protein